MICLEVYLNGEKITTTGVPNAIGVLNSNILCTLNKEEPNSYFISASGFDLVSQEHLFWLDKKINLNDIVTFKLIESDYVDHPEKVSKEERKQQNLNDRIQLFNRLKEELEGYI